MEINDITAVQPATMQTQPMVDTLGKDAFLQLLITQLKYQDPLEPMDSAQSMLQTAQFTMVEKLDIIANAVTGQTQFGQLSAMGAIVGKTATFTDTLGNVNQGTIGSANINSNGVILNIEGRQVALTDVLSIAGEASPDRPAMPIPDAPADVASMSRYELLTSTPEVYVPYDGPRKFVVGEIVDADGKLKTDVPFYDTFVAAGERWGVPPEILAGIAKAESAFKLDAVSPDNAQGMMQFLPSTAEWMGVDPSNPASAIDGAARYIRAELDKFGRMDFAVAAYNAGSGAVSKYDGIPPYAETEAYVPKVLGYAGWT